MRTTKATPKPPPGIVEALKSKTAALENATTLLKAVQAVERDPVALARRFVDGDAFDRAHSRWLAALAKWHNPDGMDDETGRKRAEELKKAERELVFAQATNSDRVWQKIQVLTLCLEEESTLGHRADHFSLLALAAIKADLLALGIGDGRSA